ncbi:MAG TPA: bifunctional phosphoserine phosphatase/homoserine phosphotransferase ThrH [Spirochaetia bacterium]|nr:bifunctional phosphoserine phosphatase/homoserine phosphotransferase ThrH [Spirochaetia bacterium]
MHIVCLDLEGVLVPEIWIAFAESTGIDELRLTTRDISDYDVLMRKRLRILEERELRLADIQRVIGTLDPLPGASEFLARLRELTQVIILSDTFVEFAKPLMEKLAWPSLFCNSLVTSPDGTITDYRLRQKEGKKRAVEALQSLGFSVIAAGDSYNDVSMLSQAETGILFRAPETILREFPDFASTTTHSELFERIASEVAPEPAR